MDYIKNGYSISPRVNTKELPYSSNGSNCYSHDMVIHACTCYNTQYETILYQRTTCYLNPLSICPLLGLGTLDTINISNNKISRLYGSPSMT